MGLQAYYTRNTFSRSRKRSKHGKCTRPWWGQESTWHSISEVYLGITIIIYTKTVCAGWLEFHLLLLTVINKGNYPGKLNKPCPTEHVAIRMNYYMAKNTINILPLGINHCFHYCIERTETNIQLHMQITAT